MKFTTIGIISIESLV